MKPSKGTGPWGQKSTAAATEATTASTVATEAAAASSEKANDPPTVPDSWGAAKLSVNNQWTEGEGTGAKQKRNSTAEKKPEEEVPEKATNDEEWIREGDAAASVYQAGWSKTDDDPTTGASGSWEEPSGWGSAESGAPDSGEKKPEDLDSSFEMFTSSGDSGGAGKNSSSPSSSEVWKKVVGGGKTVTFDKNAEEAEEERRERKKIMEEEERLRREAEWKEQDPDAAKWDLLWKQHVVLIRRKAYDEFR